MAGVHVVGAGPAGCITAINALREGHSVFLSEEHSRAGIPQNCSGLFSKGGLEKLGPYLDYKKFMINEINGANIYFDSVLFRLRRKNTVAAVCDRSELDKALAEKAENEGARITYGERIKGNFREKNIIGADGANSSVAEFFGFPRISRFVGTLQKKVKHSADEKDLVEVYLSSKIPGFFGWCIPHDGETSEIGVGVELPNDAMKAWRHLLKMKNIEVENPSASIIPVETRKRVGKAIDGKNVLLVGDAAGQTKATTGGGVLFSAWCAEIAGRNIEKPAWYDLEWRARYGHDFTIHRKIRDYLNSFDDAALRELGEKLNRISLDDYLVNYGDMDRPSRMLKPQIIRHFLSAVSISIFPNGLSSRQ